MYGKKPYRSNWNESSNFVCALSFVLKRFFFFFLNVQGIWHNASKMCLTRELWAHIFSSWGDANFIQAWKRLNVSPERRNCEAQSSAFKGWRPKWVPTCCCADHTPQQTQHFTKQTVVTMVLSIIWLKTFPSSMKPWPTLRVLYLLGPRARP